MKIIKEMNKYEKLNFFTNLIWITLFTIATTLSILEENLAIIFLCLGFAVYLFGFYTQHLEIKYRYFSDEVLYQSAIPIDTRVAMSEEMGKERKRENLKSSLFLSNKERENKNDKEN